MENVELVEFILSKLEDVQSSFMIIQSMLSSEVQEEFDNKIVTSMESGDFKTMVSTIAEANNYVLNNKLRALTLKGEVVGYIKILEFLKCDIPQVFRDFINDLN
jgi:hypothetical protein